LAAAMPVRENGPSPMITPDANGNEAKAVETTLEGISPARPLPFEAAPMILR
jgi:hypothetical protein